MELNNVMGNQAVPKKFLDIVNQDPNDSKSTRLHVDIYWFYFH